MNQIFFCRSYLEAITWHKKPKLMTQCLTEGRTNSKYWSVLTSLSFIIVSLKYDFKKHISLTFWSLVNCLMLKKKSTLRMQLFWHILHLYLSPREKYYISRLPESSLIPEIRGLKSSGYKVKICWKVFIMFKLNRRKCWLDVKKT